MIINSLNYDSVFIDCYWMATKSYGYHIFIYYTDIDWRIELDITNAKFWVKLEIDVIWWLNVLSKYFLYGKIHDRLWSIMSIFLIRDVSWQRPITTLMLLLPFFSYTHSVLSTLYHYEFSNTIIKDSNWKNKIKHMFND